MKQESKYINYYKCELKKGYYEGFTLDEELHLNLEEGGTGCYITRMLDTYDMDTTYNRLKIEGDFTDAKVEIIVAVTNTLNPYWVDDDTDLQEYLKEEKISVEDKVAMLKNLPHHRYVNTYDVLLNGLSGRYVWVCIYAQPISFASSCKINGFKLEFPQTSFTEYFPEIYQGNDFFDRYIGVFSSMFLDQEAKIDIIPRLLDFQSAPDEIVEVLASWLGIDNSAGYFTPEQLRHIITNIDIYQGCKGTKKALEHIVALVTGITPRIVENFQWNDDNISEAHKSNYRTLYGETSNHFCVILDTSKANAPLPISEKKLEKLIESYCMVGTNQKLVKLELCSHADAHCYLDVNSRLSVPEVASVDGLTLGAHITVG